MIKKDACVKSRYGIHARPSAAIATAAINEFPNTSITIIDNESNQQADAQSILSLLTMSLPCGKIVTVCASGKDEEKALEAIVAIIENFEVDATSLS
jgi:phosphotransferase system HPr (HPr) family protein